MARTFQYDLFISYGWSGNAVDEGHRAWVRQLKDRLLTELRGKRGPGVKIFFDIDTPRSGPFIHELENAITHSKLLLFVVSPGSCQSYWCQWEIQNFCDRGLCVAKQDDVLLPESRAHLLGLEPVDWQRLPGPLRHLVFPHFDFTRRVAGGTLPAVWDQFDASTQAEFDQLVIDLSNRLAEIDAVASNPVKPSGVSVFIGAAPSPSQEKEFLTPLRRDLLMRGHDVVRAGPVPGEKEDDYRIRLAAAIGEAKHCVHLLGEPFTPAGWTRSRCAWQIRRSAELHEATVFSWVDPDRDADAAEIAELQRKSGDHHFDRRQPFKDLHTALFRRIDEQRREEKGVLGTGKKVAIAYCEEDKLQVLALSKRLREEYKFQVTFALPPTDPGKRKRDANLAKFRNADAVIVYYSRGRDWLALICDVARETMNADSPKRAALVLHPPPPRKDDCDEFDFDSLHLAHEGNFSPVDAWVRSL